MLLAGNAADGGDDDDDDSDGGRDYAADTGQQCSHNDEECQSW